VQVRGVFSVKPVVPDFNRLNPLSKIKSILSLRSIVEFFKNIIKLIVIFGVCVTVIRSNLDSIMNFHRIHPIGVLVVVAHLTMLLSIGVSCLLLPLSVADYLYQKYEYIKNLRMSKDEVKRDYKQQEGDPEIKAARRHVHSEIIHR
jgi:type III secretion protein U